MFDFIRIDACPRCLRNMPDDPEPGEDRSGCPVCCGKPLRALLPWNSEIEPLGTTRERLEIDVKANETPDLKLVLIQMHRKTVLRGFAWAAGEAAMDLAIRPAGACGRVVKVAKP